MSRVTERWTQARRVEHTRERLLDAGEAVFARKGFLGAALEDIAEAAGYTRGAIYAHFGGKEELFLAVNLRYRQRVVDGFADVLASFANLDDLDLRKVAAHWREQAADGTDDVDEAALGYEFTLYLLRNPAAKARVEVQRHQTVAAVERVIVDSVERLGGSFRIPSATLAHLVVATADGVVLGSRLDGVDLYHPFLELFVGGIGAARDTSTAGRIEQ